MSAYLVRDYDQPVNLPFFPHSNISAPQVSFDPFRATDIVMVGEHHFSGHRGVICGFEEFNDDGIGSFKVKLEPDKRQVTIRAVNLIPK